MKSTAERLTPAPRAALDAEVYGQVDEPTLARALLARDEAAWREMVRRYEPILRHQLGKVMAQAMRTLLHSDAIDEVIGDFYLDILEEDMMKLRTWADGNRKAKLGSWLRMIATQIGVEHIRRAYVRFSESADGNGRDEQRRRQRLDADPNRGGDWYAIQARIGLDEQKKRRNRKSNDDKDDEPEEVGIASVEADRGRGARWIAAERGQAEHEPPLKFCL